jgi:hypothetical protein
MTVPELDSVVVALADDLDDRRLQFADIVVLHARPTVVAAALVADTVLWRLPGCVLVAVGVGTGGCLMCCRDVHWVLMNMSDRSPLAVARLAIRYYVSSVVLAVPPRPDDPAG